ncbi:MAG: aminotransferase class V-fold PLP-dependent enzyme [Patescibacteria group bacterium]
MKHIYLDHSATTPLDPKVLSAMMPYFGDNFGNPGSLHSFGVETKKAINDARKNIAAFLGCDESEIIFTSGGSESDNLAIRGLVSRSKGDCPLKGTVPENAKKPHIITSAFEHKAVLDTVKSLEREGIIKATYIKPGADGVIKVDDIKNAIRDNTVLVSIMYVNNEIGTIQPIREIGKVISGLNSKIENRKSKIYFHTDAVQATEFCPINVRDLGVDLLSLSAHKIHGPKGVGLLYVKSGTLLKPEITGGGQERGFRAGTENVPGIVGFAKAISLISSSNPKVIPPLSKGGRREVEKLRDRLIDGILERIPGSILNGDRDHLAPHIANISFINAEGEAILLNLDFLGIAVSTGSACTSRTLEPSHVLTAMGIPPEQAHGSIRFSLSRNTTEAEIDRVLDVLPGIIEKLRTMSPFDTNG